MNGEIWNVHSGEGVVDAGYMKPGRYPESLVQSVEDVMLRYGTADRTPREVMERIEQHIDEWHTSPAFVEAEQRADTEDAWKAVWREWGDNLSMD